MSCRRALFHLIIAFKMNLGCFFFVCLFVLNSGKTDSVLTTENIIAIGVIYPCKKDTDKRMDVLIPAEQNRCMCSTLSTYCLTLTFMYSVLCSLLEHHLIPRN